MKIMRKIVSIDEDLCNGCGLCLPNCAEGAISLVNGKAKLKAEKLCDGLGACLGHCPMDAIQIIEREADDFDEEAVHAELAASQPDQPAPLACGCPGSQAMSLSSPAHAGCPGQAPKTFAPVRAHAGQGPALSALGHWPVKLRLAPAEAPFLKGADILIVADCAPVAIPDFHDRIAGKVVLTACPKFDEHGPYLEKLVHILRQNAPAKISVLRMEVPCCSGLATLVARAVHLAGTDTPFEDLVVARTGRIAPAEAGPSPRPTAIQPLHAGL